MDVKPVILCGGSGTRLWPLSSSACPKQFQPLISERPMVVETALRVRPGPLSDDHHFAAPLIVGSARHGKLIADALPQAAAILEPFGRDSAPAVAAAALASDPDDLLLILPADHAIADVPAFYEAIATGIAAARDGQFVTFGIEPTFPATGYGYIDAPTGGLPVRRVERFVEKPDRATAEGYLERGGFYWNAGIFLFRAGTMVDAISATQPAIIDAVRAALGTASSPVVQLNSQAFSRSPSISIDYAVMEPMSEAGRVSVVPVNMGWSDIGDHKAVFETRRGDGDVAALGPVTSLLTTGRVSLRSEGPFVAAIGVSDVAIVATREAVLVTGLDQSQEVKEIAKAALGYGHGFLLPQGTRDHVKSWLFDTILPYWADHAWDPHRGGFKESLSLTEPGAEEGAIRRMRVQARQIYSFSHAKLLGWSGPCDELVQKGLSYLFETCWRPGRGFVHHLDRDGAATDSRMDAYDHAFALTGLAFAHRAGIHDTTRLVDDVVSVIDERLALPEGGYADDDTGSGARRANPHMHYLEAFLGLFEAFGDPAWLDRAGRMVRLFESRFFDPAHDCVVEHFTPGWDVEPSTGHIIEPGHAYEWAALLAKYEKYTAHDCGSWRRRLIAAADRLGRDPKTGFAYNAVSPTGEVIDPSRRLWPQTEMVRIRLVEPGATGIDEANAFIGTLFETYFKDAPDGLWMDKYDGDGKPAMTNTPASMLYHLLSAFSVVIDGTKA